MHDLDRTTTELESDNQHYESGRPEFEYDQAEYSEGMGYESPFTEAEEMELASELLSVSNDAELDQFLGKAFRRLRRKLGRFARSKVGRALGRNLRSIGKKVLPIAGRVVGGYFGGPAGAAIGGKIGSAISGGGDAAASDDAATAASEVFELDLEGLSGEDQEFEIARRYVRLVGAAAQNAADAPEEMPEQEAANNAITAAAQQHAPGLVQPQTQHAPSASYGRHRTGRWTRRGNRIVLHGV